jgi:hypothetical protein
MWKKEKKKAQSVEAASVLAPMTKRDQEQENTRNPPNAANPKDNHPPLRLTVLR